MWGDALRSGSGLMQTEFAPPWTFSLIFAGYFLTIIPTVMIIVGAIWMLVSRHKAGAWACNLLLSLFGFAVALVILINLKAPIHSIQKASYALFASVPLCAFFGLGLHDLTRRWRWSRIIATAFMGVFVLNAYCAYWVRPSSSENLRNLAMNALNRNESPSTVEPVLEQGAARFPNEVFFKLMLAKLRLDGGDTQRARVFLSNPAFDTAWRHLLLFRLASAENKMDVGTQELNTAIAMDPNDPIPLKDQADLAAQSSDPQATIAASRAVLRVDPYDVATHRTLANALLSVGDMDDARKHQAWADEIIADVTQRH
jgi:tetratricopeptide (TPR) repeat protein